MNELLRALRRLVDAVNASACSDTGIPITTGMPTEPPTGSVNFMIDPETGILYFWNGTVWGIVGGVSYQVYEALLTQTGTDAPVAIVLENTLGGDVVWTRNDVGSYIGTLAGAFVGNCIPNSTIGYNPGSGGYYQIYKDTDDAIGIDTFSDLFITISDGQLATPTYVKFLVYPL